jgi:hypothetical protein
MHIWFLVGSDIFLAMGIPYSKILGPPLAAGMQWEEASVWMIKEKDQGRKI